MRAAVITEKGAIPKVVDDFKTPKPAAGCELITVTTAGLGGWDILGAYREAVEYPLVVRGEGVGTAADGRRVYFGERSVLPFGAWAEQTLVPSDEVWDVPAGVDDKTAITMAIAGTGCIVPLEQAKIQKGESVLILGATGALGQIALQLARIMGAGRVVGAARNAQALNRMKERGIADAVVALGTPDDAGALKAASNGGFDVVLDMVYGAPFLAALKATREGARLMSGGANAGLTALIPLPDMLYRTHTCVGTGQRAPADRRAIWERLLKIAREHKITVDYLDFTFDQAGEAWKAQAAGPHAKITAKVTG